VPPGTTRRLVLAIDGSNHRGLSATFWGFAPERLDPGNRRFTLENTPRLVSGLTDHSADLTETFYRMVVADVRRVASPEIAELAKAVENTFRFINIGFANEMARLCDRLGINIWEVLDAAASKPFAFLPHYPGPGVGGSCIPIVPHYLRRVARNLGVDTPIVDAASDVDSAMPTFVVAKLERLLVERHKVLRGARILVVGVTYKPDVADVRHSPAIPIVRLLRRAGTIIAYHDDFVSQFEVDGDAVESAALDDNWHPVDCILVLTLHSTVDRSRLLQMTELLFDTRNALGLSGHPSVVVL
jgi:UDP-N-acetyl-D-glucosamine dehydrogenase